MPTGSQTEKVPLRSPVLHILLALSAGELHGLGIADQVGEASRGAVNLGPGTLYRSLEAMTTTGLIDRVETRAENADPRRKYYRLTRNGEALLREEMERIHHLVEVARARNVLPEGV
jgi:DNA-binding PadR family transcriptional regulator